ncbi:obscurin [Rhagoletis pomonella]|uniref:obscurin n=1 Tax=Rhagoletis pomonella TaxID=28610 RepID=UPI00177C949C|nr:obscurin [Rhagoletis pomonella]
MPNTYTIVAISGIIRTKIQISSLTGDDKTLSEHLKLPIQRINDYQFLLKELIKYSQNVSDNTKDLQKALELMLSVPNRAFHNKFLSSIEGYRGNIYKIGRLLNHDWWTVKESAQKLHERYLFLFKSRILITKVRKINEERSIFLLQNIIKLPDCNIENNSVENLLHITEKQGKSQIFLPLELKPHRKEIRDKWFQEIVSHRDDDSTLQEHLADDLRVDTSQVLQENELLFHLPQKAVAHNPYSGIKASDVAQDYYLSEEEKAKYYEENKLALKIKGELLEERKTLEENIQSICNSENVLVEKKVACPDITEEKDSASATERKDYLNISHDQTTIVESENLNQKNTDESTKEFNSIKKSVDLAKITTYSTENNLSSDKKQDSVGKDSEIVNTSSTDCSFKPFPLIKISETPKIVDTNRTITLNDIPFYKESSKLTYNVTAAADDNNSSRQNRNVTNIKGSASLQQWSNSLTNLISTPYEGGGTSDPPPPLPPNVHRMPGFFQPLPRISYETTIEILIVKTRPPSPPPLPQSIKKLILHNESLEQKSENFLKGIYDSQCFDTSIHTAKQKLRYIKSAVIKSSDSTKYAEDTVKKAKARDFLHIFTPPLKNKRPIYEIVEVPLPENQSQDQIEDINQETKELGAELEVTDQNINKMEDYLSGYSSKYSRKRAELSTTTRDYDRGSYDNYSENLGSTASSRLERRKQDEHRSIFSSSRAESRTEDHYGSRIGTRSSSRVMEEKNLKSVGKPVITRACKSVQVQPGESAHFEVQFAEKPGLVVWLKDNKPLVDKLADRVIQTEAAMNSYRLDIKNCRESDAGTYTVKAAAGVESTTCSAQLAVGQVSGHDETETNVAPVFLVQLKDAEMLENTHFRFMIKVMGDPKPRVGSIYRRQSLRSPPPSAFSDVCTTADEAVGNYEPGYLSQDLDITQQQAEDVNTHEITLWAVFNEIATLRAENARVLSLVTALYEDKNTLAKTTKDLRTELCSLQKINTAAAGVNDFDASSTARTLNTPTHRISCSAVSASVADTSASTNPSACVAVSPSALAPMAYSTQAAASASDTVKQGDQNIDNNHSSDSVVEIKTNDKHKHGLREWLRQLKLPTSGCKATLALRVSEVPKNQRGVCPIVHTGLEGDAESETDEVQALQENENAALTSKQQTNVDHESYGNRDAAEVNVLFLQREVELLKREKEFLVRENEFLRRLSSIGESAGAALPRRELNNPVSRSVDNLKGLVPEYNGDASVDVWVTQIENMRVMFAVDEDTMRLLLFGKLKGKAQQWLYSKPNFLLESFVQLVTELKEVFGTKHSKLSLRRKFEMRKWQQKESFNEYYNDKVMLANLLKLEEEELVEYIIDGIADEQLRIQGYLQCYSNKVQLLQAYSKVKQKIAVVKSSAISVTKNADVRCYNCNLLGHYASECQKPAREKGACYACGSKAHRVNCLIDSGSPISFIRKSSVPGEININLFPNVTSEFFGLNKSKVETYGKFLCSILLYGKEFAITFIIVADRTMVYDAVLGRDFLKICGFKILKDYGENVELERLNSQGESKFECKNCGDLKILENDSSDKDCKSKEKKNDYVKEGNTKLEKYEDNDEILLEDVNESVGGVNESVCDDNERSNGEFLFDKLLMVVLPSEHHDVNLKVGENASFSDQIELNHLFEKYYVKWQRFPEPKVKSQMKLTLNSVKPFSCPPRRLSYSEKSELQKLLDEYLEKNIIRPSESEFVSPIVLVRKKTGDLRIRFIRDYSIIAKPLSDLLRMDETFKMGVDQLLALEELKKALINAPALKFFDPSAETEIHADASKHGFGAVLLQKDSEDQLFHLIEYMSRKTTLAEEKCCAFELEILAVVKALQKWHTYLKDRKFKIASDCNAFAMTVKKRDVPDRCMDIEVVLGEELCLKAEITINRDGLKIKRIQVDTDANEEIALMKIDAVVDKYELDIDVNASEVAKRKVRELISDYKPAKTATTNVEMRIVLSDESPIFLRPRRLPFSQAAIVDAQVDEWLKDGIIEMRTKDDHQIRDLIHQEITTLFSNERCEQRRQAKLQILKIQQENKKTYYLRRKSAHPYKVGDLVAIKRTQFGSGPKLKPKFLGPYQITKSKGNNSYDVRKLKNSEGPINSTSCAEYMKPWAKDSDATFEANFMIFMRIEDKNPFGSLSGQILQPGEKTTFVWKRNGVDFDPEERFKVLFGEDEDSLALVFQHVKPEDAGIYTCVAQTSTGNISCSAELSVQGAIQTLHREPEKPSLIIEHREANTSIGGTAILELQCKGFPKPGVQWKHDGEVIELGEKHKILYADEESMSLVIKNITTEDAGEYTILAKNELGEEESSISLVVKAGPRIKRVNDVSCFAGETIKLEIEIDAFPKPLINLTNNGRDITNDANVKLSTSSIGKCTENIVLEVSNIELHQSGNYSIRATNDISQSSEYWQCIVKSKPIIIKHLEEEYVNGEKETVIMSVKVDAFPEAKVRWFQDGNEINFVNNVKYSSSVEGNEHVLKIKEVTRVDSAKYEVIAENEHGCASSETKLLIKCTPELTKKLSNIIVTEGDCNVDLEVRVHAYPPPKIQWYIDGIEIDEKRKEFRRVEENNVYKLVLKEVNTSMQGTYCCKIMNDYGKLENECIVTVNCKPKIRKPLKDTEVQANGTLTLETDIYAVPEPTVKWFKDGQEIEADARVKISRDSYRSEDYFLSLTICQPKDAGTYEVKALNSIGESQSQCKVLILTIPEIQHADILEKHSFESVPLKYEIIAKGIPKPEALWYHDGKPIHADNRVATFVDGDKYRLEIKELELSDAGEYKVIIKNKCGEKSLQGVLSLSGVAEYRKPLLKSGLRDITTNKGHSLAIPIVFTADPQPKITWLKDGKPLKEQDNCNINETVKDIENGLKEYTYTLNFDECQHKDSGHYELQILNKYGEISTSGWIDVLSKPEIIGLKDCSCLPDDTIAFDAIIYANPKPKVTWTRGNENLCNNENCEVIADLDGDKYRLVFQCVKPVEDGLYTLTAVNDQGTTTSSFHLNVKVEKPTFITLPEDQSVQDYFPAVVHVLAHGIPKPTIEWKKGLTIIHDGIKKMSNEETYSLKHFSQGSDQLGSQFEISNFKPTDAGTYSVVAKNQIGSSEAQFQLSLLELAPSFESKFDNAKEISQDEDLVLQCKVLGSPLPLIRWFKDGEELKPNEHIKIASSPSGLIKLEISNINPIDSGAYKVVVSNPLGEVSSLCAIAVTPKEHPPSFVRQIADVKVSVDEPLKLEAQVVGFPAPEVKWLKNGVALRPSNSLNFINNPNGIVGLSIDNVQPQDAGIYKCIIVNKNGEMEGSSTVTVLAKDKEPEFITELHDTNCIEGFPLKLQIKVVGNPLPDIKWFRNGKEIFAAKGQCTFIQNNDGACSLVIEQANLNDSGLYEVVASNIKGAASSKARLHVALKMDESMPEEPPRFVSSIRDVNANEGDEINISAAFVGNPIPEVIWSKDGTPLSIDNRFLIECDGKHVNLNIAPAEASDSGTYSCLLANPLGEDNSSCEANVRKVYKKPIFTQKICDQQQLIGSDAKIAVTASGVPNPELSWYFQDKPISTGDKYHITNDGDHHGLVIKNCQINDHGVYKCIARNREGSDVTQGRLDVVNELKKYVRSEPPTFLKKIGDCEIYPGMTAKFTACATGSPEPEAEWFKNDQKLFPSGKISMDHEPNGLLRLTIKDADDTDVGRYSCHIFNPYGDDTCHAHLFYDTIDDHNRRPLSEQYNDLNKFKKTGVPTPLTERPTISRMTDSTLRLSWRPSVLASPRYPVTYLVEMMELPEGDWRTLHTGVRNCICDIKGLEPFREYRFRVRVKNKYGVSDPSPYVQTYR